MKERKRKVLGVLGFGIGDGFACMHRMGNGSIFGVHLYQDWVWLRGVYELH